MPKNNLTQATKEEIREYKRRCWHSGCKNISLIENHSGYRYCLKHFMQDRKNGYFSKMRKVIWSNFLSLTK
jgi:hypothetical protein